MEKQNNIFSPTCTAHYILFTYYVTKYSYYLRNTYMLTISYKRTVSIIQSAFKFWLLQCQPLDFWRSQTQILKYIIHPSWFKRCLFSHKQQPNKKKNPAPQHLLITCTHNQIATQYPFPMRPPRSKYPQLVSYHHRTKCGGLTLRDFDVSSLAKGKEFFVQFCFLLFSLSSEHLSPR